MYLVISQTKKLLGDEKVLLFGLEFFKFSLADSREF